MRTRTPMELHKGYCFTVDLTLYPNKRYYGLAHLDVVVVLDRYYTNNNGRRNYSVRVMPIRGERKGEVFSLPSMHWLRPRIEDKKEVLPLLTGKAYRKLAMSRVQDTLSYFGQWEKLRWVDSHTLRVTNLNRINVLRHRREQLFSIQPEVKYNAWEEYEIIRFIKSPAEAIRRVFRQWIVNSAKLGHDDPEDIILMRRVDFRVPEVMDYDWVFNRFFGFEINASDFDTKLVRGETLRQDI